MQWIKHDTNANQDAKLKRVRMKYGLEGYGLYWYLIELIAADVDQNNLTFELEHDAEIISFDTGIHVERINEMMSYMVNVGLFECANNAITCLKLLKRLDQSMTSNKKMRELITKAKASHDGVMMKSDSVMQEENRIEEKRINNTSSDKDDSQRSPLPKPLSASLLEKITEHWQNQMPMMPRVDLTKNTQINKKRWRAICKILKDHPEYLDHEYWLGHFGQLATLPELEWQRQKRQLTFDQAVQLDKFERNLGYMRSAQ